MRFTRSSLRAILPMPFGLRLMKEGPIAPSKTDKLFSLIHMPVVQPNLICLALLSTTNGSPKHLWCMGQSSLISEVTGQNFLVSLAEKTPMEFSTLPIHGLPQEHPGCRRPHTLQSAISRIMVQEM